MDEQAIAREMYHLMFLIKKQGFGPNGHPGQLGVNEQITRRDMMFLNGIKQLHKGELVKMSELSSNFQITPAAISQEISHLEKHGLVERIVLETDRRSVYVKLTPLAEEVIIKQEKQMNQNMIALLRYLGEEDAEAMLRIMRKSVDFMNGSKK